MTEAVAQPSPESRRALHSRAFRPLSWWLAISIVLLAYDYHQKHAPQTTVAFSVTIEGKAADSTAYAATLDNRGVLPGSIVPIGWRTLRVEATDAEPVHRSLFVWYGQNDAGAIDLAWSKGWLDLLIAPQAREVRCKGPHHSFSLADSSGKTVAVPVGAYEISARFDHFSEQHQITVARNETNRLVIKPALGAVSLASDPPGAQFRLVSVVKRDVAAEGTAPALVKELPESEYRLSIWRGDYLKESSFTIKNDETNLLTLLFEYGTVTLGSEPPGATIYRDGKEVGQTPATLTELRLGQYQFRLQKEGFEPVEVPVEIQGTNVIAITTNLVSIEYAQAMVNARLEAVKPSPDHRRALGIVEQALKSKPGDAEALTLKTRLENAFQEAQRNQAQREKQQVEQKQREERDARQRVLAERFHNATKIYTDVELFDAHHFEFRSDLSTVRAAVMRAVRKTAIKWSVTEDARPDNNTIILHGTPSAFLTLSRRCSILASEVTPGEVHVYAKFWDYLPAGGALITDKFVPVHKSFFKPEESAAIEQRRRAIAENFYQILQNELR